MTKEERDQEKRERAQQEREAYELHQKYRIAMARAAQTGQPQFLARDRDGKDVYVEVRLPTRPCSPLLTELAT